MANKTRTEECGPLAFHSGTEQELLQYVLKNADDNADSVIKCIDEFCTQEHWMMHVGPEKGSILDSAMESAKPFDVLELGTYCGYSTLRMAQLLPENGKVYTVDPNNKPNSVAEQLAKKANISDKIVFLTGFSQDVIPTLVNKVDKFDLVFIDHDKSAYYPDLLSLEKLELVAKNTHLVADNVVIFKINDYLNHVRTSGKYNTSLYETNLEYDDGKYKDGVEVSVMKRMK